MRAVCLPKCREGKQRTGVWALGPGRWVDKAERLGLALRREQLPALMFGSLEIISLSDSHVCLSLVCCQNKLSVV